MSIRVRATLGALLVCFGLLLVVGAGSYKGTAIIKHERHVAKGEASEAPSPSGPNALMVIGWIGALAGAVLTGFAVRDMARQIDETQSSIETQMRMEIAVKRDPKPKP
jgi:hypothetical protein